MRPAAVAHDIDEVAFSDRSSGKAWIDWIFSDRVTVDPIPDLTFSLCETAGAEQTLLNAGTSATTDVVFDLDTAPSFLGRSPSDGRVFLINTAPEGPPVAGTFPVIVTANVSSGEDSESFTLIVEACDPFSWIREFGPAWVVFLAFVAIFVTLGITLWRGAKGKRRR